MYLMNDSKSIYVSLGIGDACLCLNMAITLGNHCLQNNKDTPLENLENSTVSPSLRLQMFLQIIHSPLEGTGS